MNTSNQTRILVVEDDTAIRATLVDILELNGYEVVQASNGPTGLSGRRRSATVPTSS